MIILTDGDKKNITNMDPKCTKYCVFPDYLNNEEIDKFMKT